MQHKLIRMLLNDDDDTIVVPVGAKALRAEPQGESGIAVVFLADVETSDTEPRSLIVIRGYGREFTAIRPTYVGTVGVAHVFEVGLRPNTH